MVWRERWRLWAGCFRALSRAVPVSPTVFFWKSGFSRSVYVVHWRINSLFFATPTPVLPAGCPRGKRPRGRGFSSVMFSWRLRCFCASRACWACTSLCQRAAISSGCLLSGSFSRRESSSRRRTSSCRRLLCWAMFAAKCNVLCGKEKAASGAEAAV